MLLRKLGKSELSSLNLCENIDSQCEGGGDFQNGFSREYSWWGEK